jgi:hypothetical protein
MAGTNYKSGEFNGSMQQLIDEAYANMQKYTNIPDSQLNALDSAARQRYLPDIGS